MHKKNHKLSLQMIRSILVMCCCFLLSGCLGGSYVEKSSLDQKISRARVQVSADSSQPDVRNMAFEKADQASSTTDLKKTQQMPDEFSVPEPQWEEIAESGILGLDAPVKQIGPEPLDQVTMKLDLAFDNADLTEVLDLLLYEHYNLKYMIDPSINAKLTFHIHGEFTTSEIVEKLNSILHVNGLAIVEGIGSILKIVPKSDSPRSAKFQLTDTKVVGQIGDVTRLIKVKYVNAVDISKTLATFMSKNAQIVPDQVHNSIILTDTPENILKVASIIDIMDTPFFRDISWKIIAVRKADAETVATELNTVFKANGLFTRPGISNGGFYITPLRTINAVLIVTRWPEILDTVSTWIKIMDQVNENSMDVFVYYVENGSASELTDILRQIYGGHLTTETDSDRRSAGKTGADSGSQKIVQAQSDAASTDATSYSGSSVPSVAGDLIDDITIIADETNNAIVFKANPNDYFMIQKILEKLDILPRQVLLNVVVAEVTHNNSSELGVQWKLNAGIGDYQAAAMSDINDSLISTTTGLGSMNGFSLGLFNAADALKALVKAVGTDSKLNILSSPNIIGVDNKEAKIEVTQDIPVISGSQVTSDGAVTNTIEYKTTGIILTATPSINSRGLVKLDLVQEVSEVGSFDTNTKNYPILSRRATTSLVVENEQTIFIGGMMRENSSVSDTGVPVLKDIPGLGYLFKQKKTEGSKTELIFLITPHVIQSRSEADEITQEFTNEISQVKRLIAD